MYNLVWLIMDNMRKAAGRMPSGNAVGGLARVLLLGGAAVYLLTKQASSIEDEAERHPALKCGSHALWPPFAPTSVMRLQCLIMTIFLQVWRAQHNAPASLPGVCRGV